VALTTIIPTREAAPAITNLVVFPLYFLSGVFIPESEIPDGVLTVADLFPIRHLFDALLAGFDPATGGATVELGQLVVVAAWGLLGFAVALRRFRWEPHG
jgi:ABC-2 type transport system permease protein